MVGHKDQLLINWLESMQIPSTLEAFDLVWEERFRIDSTLTIRVRFWRCEESSSDDVDEMLRLRLP